MLATSLADSAFLAVINAGTYAAGSLVDIGWMVGYLLIGMAALEPERDLPDEGPARPAPL